MTSLRARLLFILITTLIICGSRAIIPACFGQGAETGRVVCEDVDLTWVTAQDVTSAFQGTSRLSEITLRRCDVLPDISFLTSGATSGLKSLTLDGVRLRKPLTIDPFIQFITSLESLTFSNMMDMETVDFMRIEAIRKNWESLRTLTIGNCSLLSLNPELWGFLPRVEKLNFSHNNLSIFDLGTGGLRNLIEFDASYNRIRLMQNLHWNRLPSLEKFYMTSNKLVDAEILNKLPNKAVEIRLDYNSLSKLTLNLVAESDLQTLKLSNNSLQTIHPSFYDSNRKNLEKLELDGNRGLNISRLVSGLNKLESLSLRFCYITKVDKQFQNLRSLAELDLAENWLENIPQSAFIGSSTLRHLNLRSNHLSTLNFLEAAGAPDMAALSSLDLTDNNLNILPSFIKAPNMRLLSIRGNSLDNLSGCDYKKALIKLESICAPALQPDSSCEYQSYIETAQQSASRLKVYNDERCCSNPVPTNPACCMQSRTTCNSGMVNIDLLRTCPTHDMLCTATSPNPTKVVSVNKVVTPSPRKLFENLEDAYWIVAGVSTVDITLNPNNSLIFRIPSFTIYIFIQNILAILGYILVLVLLGFTIYFLYRKVRADKRRRPFRLKQNVHKENRLDQSTHHVSMNNGPCSMPQKFRVKQLDSRGNLGSCSLESNSNYSEVVAFKSTAPNPKPDSPISSTFRGRQKFGDTKLRGGTNMVAKNVYIAQEQQQETAFCSPTESPNHMSVYSYATTPGINSAQCEDHRLSFSVPRSKYLSDGVDGPPALPSSKIPLLPSSIVHHGMDSKQVNRIRDRRHSMTMSPIVSHPVRDPGP